MKYKLINNLILPLAINLITYPANLIAQTSPQPPATFPAEGCALGMMQKCVDFGNQERGKAWISNSPTQKIFWATTTLAVWDTHAMITLKNVSETTSCPAIKDSYNQDGSRLFIQTINSKNQSMFLLPSNGGMFMERQIFPDSEISGEIRWLQAPAIAANDRYDYFIEFVYSKPTDYLKNFRVEAFVHFSTPPDPKDPLYQCYLERPDVRSWSSDLKGAQQGSTGQGNEPVH